MRLIAAHDQPIHVFLDLGCGDGILGGTILAQYSQARGVLLDFSEPMLQAAQARLGDQNVVLIQADYTDPAWTQQVSDAAPFDLIVSGYSIHHQTDERKQSLYAEIYRLLQPGGLFINIEHVAPATAWGESIWESCYIDGLCQLFERQGKPKERAEVVRAYRESTERAANILAPVETQCDWLRRIGFVDVDCYFKIFELAVFGGRRRNNKREDQI